MAALAVAVMAGSARVSGQNQEDFRFRSGVDLVNVTATVVDRNGRFVPGLSQNDFIVYEENELQEVTHFSNERVPVSLRSEERRVGKERRSRWARRVEKENRRR